MHRALAGDFVPRAHMGLLAKDTGLAVTTAHAAGFSPALGVQAATIFAQAVAMGLGQHDDAALFSLLQSQCIQQGAAPLP